MNARFLLGLLSSLVFLSCGGAGTAGGVVAPKEHTGAEVLGTTACSADQYPEPLVVDLPSTERLDLEVAMGKSIALVTFDCKQLKVAKRCKLSGGYEFAGVSRKEQVLHITSSDELAVNLPFSAVKLNAEMQQGRSIDLAMVLIGKRSATPTEVTRDDLEGSCEGVTHFVRAASLGAFSMATGTKGQVAAAADLFGVGASGKSATERKNMNRDGNVEACKASAPGSESPPQECQSALRLELIPIAAKRAAESKPEKTASVAVARKPCPTGYQLAGDLCTKDEKKVHVCAREDEAGCRAQCEAGDPESCVNLGYFITGKGSEPEDKWLGYFKKACDADFADGCRAQGDHLGRGDKRPLSREKQAAELLKKGCDLGSARSCEEAGNIHGRYTHFKEMRSPQTAVGFYKRGCALGAAHACTKLAQAHLDGEGAPKDVAKALSVLTRACDGAEASSVGAAPCRDMGTIALEGKSVPKNLKAAQAAFSKACSLAVDDCAAAGKSYAEDGDMATATKRWESGCQARQVDATVMRPADPESCRLAAESYENGKGVTKDAAKAKQLYASACDVERRRAKYGTDNSGPVCSKAGK